MRIWLNIGFDLDFELCPASCAFLIELCKVCSQWKATLSAGSQLLALCTMLWFSVKETFTLPTPTLRTSHGKWQLHILSVSQCWVCGFSRAWFLLLTWQAACSAQTTEGPHSLRESLRNIYMCRYLRIYIYMYVCMYVSYMWVGIQSPFWTIGRMLGDIKKIQDI